MVKWKETEEMTLKQYIEKMIRTRPLKVSEPNSYILGVNAEYDLLLLKKDAKPIKEMNIFSPEDVEGVVEVKNSGLFGVRKKTNNEQKTLKDEVDLLLEDFQKDYKVKITLGNFDEKLYNKFLKYCIEEKKHSANTVHRNVGLLKTFLGWSFEKKYT